MSNNLEPRLCNPLLDGTKYLPHSVLRNRLQQDGRQFVRHFELDEMSAEARKGPTSPPQCIRCSNVAPSREREAGFRLLVKIRR